MDARAVDVELRQRLLQRLVASRRVVQELRQRDHRIHLLDQPQADPLHVTHGAEMGHVADLRPGREQAPDRILHLQRIELHRRGGRDRERPAVDVELAVGDTEAVAGEPGPRALVPHRKVVEGVAGRVREQQRPAGKLQHLSVPGFEHALQRRRHQAAIGLLEQGIAIDLARAGGQLRRIDEMRRTARMHHQLRRRQLAQQRARTTGMVEVDVGGDEPVDRVRRQPRGIERREHVRHAVQGAAVDEGRAAVLDHQVRGAERRPLAEAGVDDGDAVACPHALSFHRGPRCSLSAGAPCADAALVERVAQRRRNSSIRSTNATSIAARNTP